MNIRHRPLLALALSAAVALPGCGGGGGGGDTTAPTVTITSPADGSALADTQELTLKGKAVDDVGVATLKVTINGTTSNLSSNAGSFNEVLAFTGTSVSVTVTATDSAGNVGTDSIDVSVEDLTAPEVTLDTLDVKYGIEDGYVYTVTGTITDDVGIDMAVITVDGVDSDLSIDGNGDYSFDATMTGASDDVTVTATDVGGNVVSVSDTKIRVARGELDEGSFGEDADSSGSTDGFNVPAISNPAQFNEVAEDSQGRIVAFGWQRNSSNYDFFLARFTAAGKLDTTFAGGTGYVQVDDIAGGSGGDYGQGVALDADDNIYVTGNSRNGSGDDDMTVMKFDDNGDLDTTYGGGDGIFIHDFGSSNEEPLGIVVDDSGRAIVVGDSNTAGDRDMVIWRIKADGSGLDTTFAGGDGYVVDSAISGAGDDLGNRVIIDGDGNYLVSGGVASGSKLTLWRYLDDGTLDATFGGGNGYVTLAISGYVSGGAFHIAREDADGNIVAAGNATYPAGTENDAVLARFDSSGNLDTSFGDDNDSSGTPDGYTMWVRTDNDYARDLAFDGLSNIVVSGEAWSVATGVFSYSDMIVWRYTPDGQLDDTFGGDIDTNGEPDGFIGHHSAAGGGQVDGGLGMFQTVDGRIVVVGFSFSSTTGTDSTVWRLR